jgi:AcrR family transcriptional regulator
MAGALPLLGESPRERRDAARNRDALLHAAQEMVQNGGVDCVTMDRVAEAAGVGKGTVFRRFESRAGLMAALVNALEMDWQDAIISGPAPLGPGAPPLERLLAMGRSRMDLNLTHAELMDAAGWQKTHGHAAHAFIVMHVRHLLSELGVAGDLHVLASALLAPLNATLLRQQIDYDGLSRDRIFEGWADLVGRVVGPENS